MAKIIIDGAKYDFDVDFDLDEARIIKRYSGMSLKQVENADFSDPDLIAAFVHISLRRGGVPEAELESRTGRVKIAQLDFEDDDDGADAGPPANGT